MTRFWAPWLMAALVLMCGVPAQAMTLERVGSDLFATGLVVDADFIAFREALAKGGLKRLVLVNSPGGDLWTAMQVTRMIRSAELDTLVAGPCVSACSLLFIAGKERAFASGYKPRGTYVGIHGAHNRETRQINNEAMPQMYALYKSQIGDKFDHAMMNQALYDIEDANGMLRMRELQRNRPNDQAPWFCPKGNMPPAKCQRYVGKDAFSLGIVTSAQTVELELPAAFRPQLGFFGRGLPEPAPDTEARVRALVNEACRKTECKYDPSELVGAWLSKDTHRALALGLSQPGYGQSSGMDDPGRAMLLALFYCNHSGATKKLCQLVALDGNQVDHFYDESVSQGPAILLKLGAPLEEALRIERADAGMGSATGYRTERYGEVTPRDIPGVRRLDTEELVALLKAPAPPRMIDVIVTLPQMLPTALHFVSGGLAFADPALDAGFDLRFRNMLAAAAPDKSAPLVFYCAGAASWHSVNASLRAVKAGYTNVMWYRGGLPGWQAAGLPTLGKVPVAVIH